jgi:hypothetical protein
MRESRCAKTKAPKKATFLANHNTESKKEPYRDALIPNDLIDKHRMHIHASILQLEGLVPVIIILFLLSGLLLSSDLCGRLILSRCIWRHFLSNRLGLCLIHRGLRLCLLRCRLRLSLFRLSLGLCLLRCRLRLSLFRLSLGLCFLRCRLRLWLSLGFSRGLCLCWRLFWSLLSALSLLSSFLLVLLCLLLFGSCFLLLSFRTWALRACGLLLLVLGEDRALSATCLRQGNVWRAGSAGLKARPWQLVLSKLGPVDDERNKSLVNTYTWTRSPFRLHAYTHIV